MTKLFAKEKQPHPTIGLKNYAPIYRHRRSDARVRDAHKIIKRQSLRSALVTNYKVKCIRHFKYCEEHTAVKAQRTCLVRAKNLMALSYAALRGPSVYASLDVCSILFFYITIYSA